MEENVCPMCGCKVNRVKDVPADDCAKTGKCVSEYYVHTHKDNLIKVIDPYTPTDAHRDKTVVETDEPTAPQV